MVAAPSVGPTSCSSWKKGGQSPVPFVPFIVLYDACVLYPAALRDLLVRSAQTGSFQAKWTRRILDECFLSLQRNRPDLRRERLARTRQELEKTIPDVEVTGYEAVARSIAGLPDMDDRHVVAAAIRTGAIWTTTASLKHGIALTSRCGQARAFP